MKYLDGLSRFFPVLYCNGQCFPRKHLFHDDANFLHRAKQIPHFLPREFAKPVHYSFGHTSTCPGSIGLRLTNAYDSLV